MANAWGLPDNEYNQVKRGLGIADAAPTTKPASRKKAPSVPSIGEPDMRSYRYMTAQELANEGAGPIKSLVGGFSGSLANKIAGDEEGRLYEYTSPEAQNRVEGAKISRRMAENLGQVEGKETVIPGILSRRKAPSLVSEASAAELPPSIGSVGQSAALNATAGSPKVAAEEVTKTQTQTAVNAGIPSIGDLSDKGSGYAMVDGKKIDYPAIGTSSDPLKASHDGSGRVAGQARNSIAAIGDIIARQGSGEITQEYKDQVANAIRVNAANGFAPTAEQINTLGLSSADVVSVLAANNKGGRYDKHIADLQNQQVVDQGKEKLAIESAKNEGDLDYKNKSLAISAPLIEAQAKNQLADAKAKEFAASPEGIKQKQAQDDSKEAKKDAKELVKTYYNTIKQLNLPAGWEGKHMELAKRMARAADPTQDYGIYYSPGSNRAGIATKKSVFDPLLNKYRKAGYPEADALANAYRDLQTLEKQQGITLHEPMPNLDRLIKNANEPTDTLGA